MVIHCDVIFLCFWLTSAKCKVRFKRVCVFFSLCKNVRQNCYALW